MRLKKLLLGSALAASLVAFGAGPVLAAEPTFPTPGTPSCHGLFIGYVSSNGLNNPAQESKLTGTPVQELQQFVRTICQ